MIEGSTKTSGWRVSCEMMRLYGFIGGDSPTKQIDGPPMVRDLGSICSTSRYLDFFASISVASGRFVLLAAASGDAESVNLSDGEHVGTISPSPLLLLGDRDTCAEAVDDDDDVDPDE